MIIMNNEAPTLFRYAGGKYYAIKLLRPFWEAVKHDEYREPFIGGGAVFFAKPKVKYNWLNDIHDDLITTYKVIANSESRQKLLKRIEKEVATKERHTEIKNFKPTNELDTAFRYFYLNRTSFSGKMKNPSWGYRPKRSLPPERWIERIIPCGEKLEDTKITCLDFQEVIESKKVGKSAFMFLDPPYFKAKQESHYAKFFRSEDHKRLANTLKDTEFKFCLTYDDCLGIRDLYSWAEIYPVEFFYRLDNSQQRSNKRMIGREVVITNYKLPEKQQKTMKFSLRLVNHYDRRN